MCAQKCCLICRKTFTTAFELAEHANTHTGEYPFMCSNCGHKFNSIAQYIIHCKTYPGHHYFLCKKCKQTYYTKTSLEDHECSENNFEILRAKTSRGYKKQCATCMKCYTPKDVNLNEQQNHSCNTCGTHFSNQANFRDHFCKCIFQENQYILCSCLNKFLMPAFKEHVGNLLKCCACTMAFKTLGNLLKHIRTHTKEKPYICQKCGLGFSQIANLRNHMTSHLEDTPLKCLICQFSCKTESGLKKHVKKHEEGLYDGSWNDLRRKSVEEYQCALCGKMFRFKRNLSMHVRIHLREKDNVTNRLLLCSLCGKFINNLISFKRHYRVCSRGPITCKTCGKVSANRELLQKHEKIHASNKYQCKICSKSFTLKNYLTRHMKIHGTNNN